MAAKIVLRPVAELRPHAGNARVHSAEQLEQIKASMLAFGFTNPLLVDEAGVLIAGHGRLEAASALGIAKVPVIVLRHLSPALKEALRLADNRIAAHGFLREAVILSDDAGQFDVGRHALCWVHAERLVHRLDTYTDAQRAAQQHLRALIWWFYADLKAYCADSSARRRPELHARFDRILRRRTGFVILDRLLERRHERKPDLPRVLDRPDIPLHTKGSENDIRCQVTKRKISGGTHSTTCRDCGNAFFGLATTCAKLGVSFWDYLGHRPSAAGATCVPALPDLVRLRAIA